MLFVRDCWLSAGVSTVVEFKPGGLLSSAPDPSETPGVALREGMSGLDIAPFEKACQYSSCASGTAGFTRRGLAPAICAFSIVAASVTAGGWLRLPTTMPSFRGSTFFAFLRSAFLAAAGGTSGCFPAVCLVGLALVQEPSEELLG